MKQAASFGLLQTVEFSATPAMVRAGIKIGVQFDMLHNSNIFNGKPNCKIDLYN